MELVERMNKLEKVNEKLLASVDNSQSGNGCCGGEGARSFNR